MSKDVQHINLRESITHQGAALKINRDNPDRPYVVGMKISGLISRNNNRKYLTEAYAKAKPLYEGAHCNLNHNFDPNLPTRNTQDRFGVFRDVALQEGQPHGNLYYNPKHPYAETFEWFVEHEPGCIGLSHNADGEYRNEMDGSQTITHINEVKSIDVVADPATTKGLFESYLQSKIQESNMTETPLSEGDPLAGEGTGMDLQAECGQLAAKIFTDEGMDEAAKRKKLLDLFKLAEAPKATETVKEGEEEDESDDDEDKMLEESLRDETDPKKRKLLESFAATKHAKKQADKETKAKQLLESHGIKNPSSPLIVAVAGCSDDTARVALIESLPRPSSNAPNPPKSSNPSNGQGVTHEQFEKAVLGI